MEDTRQIKITINNIKTERGGQLIAFIFLENGFPKQHEHSLMRFVIPARQPQQIMTVSVPAVDEFAIKILHDENGDGMVTKNWTGFIPYDGMGFSNGAEIKFSAPSFEDARIVYHSELSPTISLQYF